MRNFIRGAVQAALCIRLKQSYTGNHATNKQKENKMLEVIKLIKENFKMPLIEFILGSFAFAAFIFSMAVLVLLGGSLL